MFPPLLLSFLHWVSRCSERRSSSLPSNHHVYFHPLLGKHGSAQLNETQWYWLGRLILEIWGCVCRISSVGCVHHWNLLKCHGFSMLFHQLFLKFPCHTCPACLWLRLKQTWEWSTAISKTLKTLVPEVFWQHIAASCWTASLIKSRLALNIRTCSSKFMKFPESSGRPKDLSEFQKKIFKSFISWAGFLKHFQIFDRPKAQGIYRNLMDLRHHSVLIKRELWKRLPRFAGWVAVAMYRIFVCVAALVAGALGARRDDTTSVISEAAFLVFAFLSLVPPSQDTIRDEN